MISWTEIVNSLFWNIENNPYYEACIKSNIEEAKRLFEQGHRADKVWDYCKYGCGCGMSGCHIDSKYNQLASILDNFNNFHNIFTKMVYCGLFSVEDIPDYMFFQVFRNLNISIIEWFLREIPPAKLAYVEDPYWKTLFFAVISYYGERGLDDLRFELVSRLLKIPEMKPKIYIKRKGKSILNDAIRQKNLPLINLLLSLGGFDEDVFLLKKHIRKILKENKPELYEKDKDGFTLKERLEKIE